LFLIPETLYSFFYKVLGRWQRENRSQVDTSKNLAVLPGS